MVSVVCDHRANLYSHWDPSFPFSSFLPFLSPCLFNIGMTIKGSEKKSNAAANSPNLLPVSGSHPTKVHPQTDSEEGNMHHQSALCYSLRSSQARAGGLEYAPGVCSKSLLPCGQRVFSSKQG